jgi:hypothetical protein
VTHGRMNAVPATAMASATGSAGTAANLIVTVAVLVLLLVMLLMLLVAGAIHRSAVGDRQMCASEAHTKNLRKGAPRNAGLQ